MDYGTAAYAQKTMEDGQGRRIWWAWIHEKRTVQSQAAARWAGVMSLPKLLTTLSDGTIGVEPVPELKRLRKDPQRIPAQRMEANGPLLLQGIAGDCIEVEAEFDAGDSRQFGLRIRSTNDGSEQSLVGYDRESQTLFSDTTNSSRDPATETAVSFFPNRGMERGALKLGSEPLRLRVYIDASVIETFANGRVSLSDRAYPSNPASLGIGLFSKGGTAYLRSMTVWKLAPISNDRMTSGAELFHV
jgi:sucrose-6-phosphate hydrolase SacC (GH32 family)